MGTHFTLTHSPSKLSPALSATRSCLLSCLGMASGGEETSSVGGKVNTEALEQETPQATNDDVEIRILRPPKAY